MEISSPKFEQNGMIPSEYTCEGSNVSPPLSISQIPAGTKSLALIVDDPDAPMGIWDHWLIWNIDPQTILINENSQPPGSVQGKNSRGSNQYIGPCPPDREHRYFFKFYALDVRLLLPEGTGKEALEQAMEKHIIEKAELIGRYEMRK